MAGRRKNEHAQCLELVSPIASVIECIKDGHQTVCILRGVSGSGKSTLARTLSEHADRFSIHNLDDVRKGAHEDEFALLQRLFRKIRDAMKDQDSLIVVDFENVEIDHIKSVAESACRECYEIYVMEPETDWKYCAEQCASKSSKNESAESISRKIETIKNTVPTFAKLLGVNKNIKIVNYNLVPALDPPPPQQNSVLSRSVEGSPSSSSSESLVENFESVVAIEAEEVVPLFSLAPIDRRIEMMDMGTCVTEMDLGMFMGGMEDDQLGQNVTIGETKLVEPPFKKPTGVERAVQVENFSLPSLTDPVEMRELAMLASLFAYADFTTLRHYYASFGYEQAFQYMMELREMILYCPVSMINLTHMIDEADFTESNTHQVFWKTQVEEKKSPRMSLDQWSSPGKKDLVFSLSDFEAFEDETANDEEIARQIQQELEEEDRRKHTWTSADEENFRKLKLEFPGIIPATVEDVYRSNEKNYAYAYNTLNMYVNTGTPRASNVVPSSMSTKVVPSSSPAARRLAALKKTTQVRSPSKEIVIDLTQSATAPLYTLEDAYVEILEYRRDISILLLNIKALVNSRQQHRDVQISNMRDKIQKLKREIDKCIERGNWNWARIDLHGMSAVGAVNFVLKVYRETPSAKVFTVITGAGRNSEQGVPVVRNNVHAALDEEGIKYMENNDGCITIKKK